MKTILDTLLLWQQNTKKLYETKYNCLHAAVGANSGHKRYKETKKPSCHFWGTWSKSTTAHAPCIQHHLRGEQNTQATPPSRTPGHTPTLTPHKEQACHPLGSEQRRDPVVCSHPLPPQWSLAWISYLASSQFLFIDQGWESWVTLVPSSQYYLLKRWLSLSFRKRMALKETLGGELWCVSRTQGPHTEPAGKSLLGLCPQQESLGAGSAGSSLCCLFPSHV